MLSVLLVDHDRLLREGLRFHLSRSRLISSVFEAAEADAAIGLFTKHRPDVVLMNADTPGRNVFEAARAMRALDADSKIIFMSDRDRDSSVAEALGVSASGYVLKSDTIGDLTAAITRVADGGRYFSESIRSRLTTGEDGELRMRNVGNGLIAALTPRERELMVHLGRGVNLKEAAAIMHVSYKTADNHKTSIMRKLGIHNLVELARLAIREGLVAAD